MIRELLTAEEYEKLLKRIEVRNSCAGARKSPERRWDARGFADTSSGYGPTLSFV